MIHQLRKRVHAIERRVAPNGCCPACGGRGGPVTRWINFPAALGGTRQTGSPCPTCGKANIINIVMTDQITPRLEQDGRA